nr:uncharacterized protein LOC104086026 [Nicotiana tomentosiformis]
MRDILLQNDSIWFKERWGYLYEGHANSFPQHDTQRIEVYVDKVIIKSKRSSDHIADPRKFFDRLRKYNLKINLAKHAFGVPVGKLLGFIVSHRSIEQDPSKIKVIQYFPSPKNKNNVLSFLGCLNYISCFIAQSMVICAPIFKMLRKDVATRWTEECQKAFDKIKEYLSKSLVLVPPKLERPLLLYLSMLDGAFGCKVVKGQALADHLADNPIYGEYEPLKKYFPHKEISFTGEDIAETYDSWRMYFDGATNFKGVGIRVVLVSKTGQHYPVSAKLRFLCTNNIAENEACILGLRLAINMNVQELLFDGNPWFHDIKEYLERVDYPENATHTQMRMLQRLANHFFHSGGILYRRTSNLGLMRYVDANETSRLLEEIHAGTCRPHMNGFVLANKILRSGYF